MNFVHELLLAAPPMLLGAWGSFKWWIAAKTRKRQASKGSPPDFKRAPGADGRLYSMDSFRDSRLLVVVFMSNRCPGVKAYDGRLAELRHQFSTKEVQFIGINPIDESLYPTESLKEMAIAARERHLSFPYLKDSSQELARRFGALCTPHAFVLDEARTIRYAGKIDDAFLPAKVSTHYLRDAISSLLAGKEPATKVTQPLGCAIDWSRQSSPVLAPRTKKGTHNASQP